MSWQHRPWWGTVGHISEGAYDYSRRTQFPLIFFKPSLFSKRCCTEFLLGHSSQQSVLCVVCLDVCRVYLHAGACFCFHSWTDAFKDIPWLRFLLLPMVFEGMWLERLPLLRELSLLLNFSAPRADVVGGESGWGGGTSAVHARIPALLLLRSSFGNLCWHTHRCLFKLLHNTPTQWEKTPKGCWIAPCGFPFVFLSL